VGSLVTAVLISGEVWGAGSPQDAPQADVVVVFSPPGAFASPQVDDCDTVLETFGHLLPGAVGGSDVTGFIQSFVGAAVFCSTTGGSSSTLLFVTAGADSSPQVSLRGALLFAGLPQFGLYAGLEFGITAVLVSECATGCPEDCGHSLPAPLGLTRGCANGAAGCS